MWGLAHLPDRYHPLLEQSLAPYRGEPLGHVAGRALLESPVELLRKQMLKVSRLTSSEKDLRQDEEATFDAQAMERWLDDGGTGNPGAWRGKETAPDSAVSPDSLHGDRR